MNLQKKYLFLLLIPVLLYFKPSTAETIEQLKQELNATALLDVEDYFYILEDLSKYKKLEETYSEQLREYQTLMAYQQSCNIEAMRADKAFLQNPETYEAKKLREKWYNKKTIIILSFFTGQNLLGQTKNFKESYVCRIENGRVNLKPYTKLKDK